MFLGFWNRADNRLWVPCPACTTGQLKISNLNTYESWESKRLRSHKGWDPGWIEGQFSLAMICTNCPENAMIAGIFENKLDQYEIDGVIKEDHVSQQLKIKYISPAVRLVLCPPRCPRSVQDRLMEASEVIWVNPDLAANRIRTSIDDLLDHQKIKRYEIIRRKRERLSTHKRISIFRLKNKQAAEYLEAVKWIGNSGSHERGLSIEDVFDGLDLFSYALYLIYSEDAKRLKVLAANINSRKGVRPIKPAF
jgi:hypothetical protein